MSSPALDVVAVPVLDDNYVWLLHDAASGETVVIDPGAAEPVLARAAALGWRITQIWNTHWHGDHTGGNAAIKAATGARITAPRCEAAKIPSCDPATGDRLVDDGDGVRIGAHTGRVWAVPGHTAGHIAYHLPDEPLIFVGDTLFTMGCGRLFEGTAEQMWAALARLAALPGDTLVYSAHEYTQGNLRFALSLAPDDADLAARGAWVADRRARDLPTVPTTIADERRTNPFMRAGGAAELGRLRALKDQFR